MRTSTAPPTYQQFNHAHRLACRRGFRTVREAAQCAFGRRGADNLTRARLTQLIRWLRRQRT